MAWPAAFEYDHNKGLFTSGDNSLTGFSMSMIRDEHPHFNLTTNGNCACYGVEPDTMIGVRYWSEKIAAIKFHNADMESQKVSLLAGLGHLACLANLAG